MSKRRNEVPSKVGTFSCVFVLVTQVNTALSVCLHRSATEMALFTSPRSLILPCFVDVMNFTYRGLDGCPIRERKKQSAKHFKLLQSALPGHLAAKWRDCYGQCDSEG